MKSFRLFCFAAAVLGLIVAAAARSATVDSYSNVTFNSGTNPTRVEEPTIVVVTAPNGGNYAVTAYNRLTPGPPSSVVVNVVSEDLGNGNFVVTAPTNPYGPSGQTSDPVLVVAGNRVYLIAIAFVALGQANQVVEWFSDNGGQTWSQPFTIHQNPAGPLFDDKPAAILSQNVHEPAGLNGGYVLHLAYIRTDSANQLPCGPGAFAPTSAIHFLTSTNWRMNTGQFACFTNDGSMYPSDTDPAAPQGWCEKASPGAAAKLHNPILFDVPYYTLHIGYQDFCNGKITIALSPNHGEVNWWDYQSIDDPYLLGPNSAVCDSTGKCVSASLGMTGHYNVNNGTFGLAWHHRASNNQTASGAEVMFTTYYPYRPNYYRRFDDNLKHVTASNHFSWTPAVDVSPNGNFLVTHYDWDTTADSSLKYRLYSASFDGAGNPLSGSAQLFDTQAADPSLYYGIGTQMRLGEYQGLFFWNGQFHAATVYVKNGVGDIYHLRISAP